MREEALQRNEAMEVGYKQEWGKLDLAEIVDNEIPDLERHTGRHQTPSGIADHLKILDRGKDPSQYNKRVHYLHRVVKKGN